MRAGMVIAVMLVGSIAGAAEPATRPAALTSGSTKLAEVKRPPALSISEAEKALGLLGPVRIANYTRSFEAPKGDPHQEFRDRYNYGLPAYSPYLFYGCGFPYYGYYGCGFGCNGYSAVVTPGVFYGD